MTFDERIVRKRSKLSEYYEVAEVFYDDDGKPMFAAYEQVPMGETVEDLKADFARYMEAFERPVIDEGVLGSPSDILPPELKEKFSADTDS